MKPEQLTQILIQAGRLKSIRRHCETAPGRAESVADHSWRIALLAMLLRGEPSFEDVDLDKVVRMCLIHDLGESFTGDVPVFKKTAQDTQREEALLCEWVASFPSPQREEWQSLFAEMQAQQTAESRIYSALDKMEAVLAHDESPLSSWLPLEYDLQRSYGWDAAAWSPYLTALRGEIGRLTEEKINAGKEREENA